MEPRFFSERAWSTHVVDELKILVEKGGSASEIARELSRTFGTSFSRAAVIGRCYRSGLQLQGPTRNKPKGDETARQKHPRKRWRDRVKNAAVSAPEGFKTHYRSDIDFVEEPVPAGDVAGGCRWMHGDPAERNYCGVERFRGSYCQHHYARATTRPLVRNESSLRKGANRMARL